MGKQFLGLFVLLSLQASADFQLCPSKEGVTSFNVGFDYHQTRKGQLPGVNKDILVMNEFAKMVGNKTHVVRDKDVSDKAEFLDSLKQKSAGSSTVFFNYSGHGILTQTGEFAILLPSAPNECVISTERTKPVEGFYRMASALPAKSEEGPPKPEDIRKPSKAVAGKGAKTPSPEIKELKYLHSVYNDTSENCQRFYVTASEIAEAFKGKTVFGIVDSCFSGALQLSPGMNLIYSSTDTQLSKDAEYGGVLFSAVKKMMHEYACSVDQEQKTYLTYADIMDRLPAVYFEKNSQVQAVTIEEAERRLKQALTEWRSPKKGTELQLSNQLKDLRQGQTIGANREVDKNAASICHDMIPYKREDCETPLNSIFRINEPATIRCRGQEVQVFTGDVASVFLRNPDSDTSLVKLSACSESVWIENRFLRETKEPYLHKIQLLENGKATK